MDTALFIALRYLFAKKSHNVINVISAISAAGMAIGTAALILILSVCNGFNAKIESNLSDLDPDLRVQLAEGGRFPADSALLEKIHSHPDVLSVHPVLEQQVFVNCGKNQSMAYAKGVDAEYLDGSALGSHIILGDAVLHGERGQELALVGATLARELNASPRFLEKLHFLYPDDSPRNPLAGPGISLREEKLGVGGVFSISNDVDSRLIIVPLPMMERLLGCEGRISSLEIDVRPGREKACERELSAALGPDFRLVDRYRSNESLYKLMRYEKFAVYLILLFVVIIVAFNIFGSLTMLIIEKSDDARTLSATGARDGLLKRIFVLEGWLVSLLGLGSGLVLGVALSLLQQGLGLVKMPGNFEMNAFPVVLQASDVLLTAASVALTGLLISLLAARKKF